MQHREFLPAHDITCFPPICPSILSPLPVYKALFLCFLPRIHFAAYSCYFLTTPRPYGLTISTEASALGLFWKLKGRVRPAMWVQCSCDMALPLTWTQVTVSLLLGNCSTIPSPWPQCWHLSWLGMPSPWYPLGLWLETIGRALDESIKGNVSERHWSLPELTGSWRNSPRLRHCGVWEIGLHRLVLLDGTGCQPCNF